jgi:hippurate hydrolase
MSFSPSLPVTDPRTLSDRLVALRRRLHQIPEIGLELPLTQRTVMDALAHLPLEITTGVTSSSVTAVVRGRRSAGRSVLLRADMDGLPVQEQTGLEYASRVEGAMHACGHDLHAAMLVGAAEILCARADQLCGDVVLMFQAGEEGWEGAQHMLDEGVLTAAGAAVSAAFAVHVFSNVTTGSVRTRPGPVMAASAELDVRVTGAGGHAAAPHLAHDPVPAAAEMILALQRAVGRDLDPFDPVVLSIGVVEAGVRPNVIPGSARFIGNIRTLSLASQARTEEIARRVIGGVAASHGVSAEADFRPMRPPLVNGAEPTALALETARELFGPARVSTSVRPEDGSEDFARVLDLVPGCFVSIGAGVEGAPYNHSPFAVFDDSVVIDGAVLLAELACKSLA